jgi:thioredoxin 1
VSGLLELTEGNWDEVVLGASTPILVDCWAPWCIPCRRVTPIVEDLAASFGERLAVGTLNADEAPRITARYEVLSLPTLLLFVGGEPVARVVGVPKADKLRGLIEPHLDGD